jgi:hypothetical protein
MTFEEIWEELNDEEKDPPELIEVSDILYYGQKKMEESPSEKISTWNQIMCALEIAKGIWDANLTDLSVDFNTSENDQATEDKMLHDMAVADENARMAYSFLEFGRLAESLNILHLI